MFGRTGRQKGQGYRKLEKQAAIYCRNVVYFISKVLELQSLWFWTIKMYIHLTLTYQYHIFVHQDVKPMVFDRVSWNVWAKALKKVVPPESSGSVVVQPVDVWIKDGVMED